MVLGCDVVKTPSEYAQRDHEEERTQRQGAVVAPARELSSRDPGANGYAQRDKEAMVAQGERPDLEDDRPRLRCPGRRRVGSYASPVRELLLLVAQVDQVVVVPPVFVRCHHQSPDASSRLCFVEVASPTFVPSGPSMNRIPRPSSKEMS